MLSSDNVQNIAGIFEVQFDFKDDSDALCDDTLIRDCSFNLTIPVNGKDLV